MYARDITKRFEKTDGGITMKAPDKIFVPTRFRLVDGLRVRESDTDEEYIRKDALLEWAKARKAELTSNESFVAGERKIIKEVIAKIESL